MRGQEFAVLKILIGAIFATMLLAIIFYIVSSQPRAPAYAQKIIEEMVNDANNTGLCIQRVVVFGKGDIIEERGFAVKFVAPYGDFFEEKGAVYVAKETVSLPVAVSCRNGCKVWIGSDKCL